MENKKILFVINTLGRAGAENALISLLNRLVSDDRYGQLKIYLYVLTGQGELFSDIPEGVTVLNRNYSTASVLDKSGRKALRKTCIGALVKRFDAVRHFPYIVTNLVSMARSGEVMPDKLMWKTLADECERFDVHFDLAVAFLEGGSTYYVADHVKADKKCAFVHVDYTQAGYSRKLDKDCYGKFDKIFSVSDQVKETFIKVYPELQDKAEVFHNIVDADKIIKLSGEGKGFDDGFKGKRIVTVCRLTRQKSLEVSAEAMKIIKSRRKPGEAAVRWYIIGEGDRRKDLESYIEKLGISEDFVLCGAYDNPYPYINDADIYVHATKFEGRSIAIREAMLLGKAVIASDTQDNRDLIADGSDGLLCKLDAEKLAGMILESLDNDELLKRLGRAASEKEKNSADDADKLISLL